MRRVAIRFAAIAALAFASQFHGAAQACIKFDRAAEIAMLDKAIASKDTPNGTRAALKSSRAKLKRLSRKTDSASISEYSTVVGQALELIGQKRVVWHAPETDAYRTKSLPPLPQTANSPAAIPTCG